MKQHLRSAIVAVARHGLNFTGETGRRLLAEASAVGDDALIEVIETVTTKTRSISFYCLGEIALMRARTLLTKEPETIEWIDGFSEGDVLWDVGANVGCYSLYAAATRGLKVIAFEPGASNYFLLNRNIELNRLDDLITAYCLALTNDQSADHLNMRSTGLATSLSTFGESTDERGLHFAPRFKQGMIGFSVDGFIRNFNPPFPNHIKVDVDGIDGLVISGAKETISDRRLKTILIELDTTNQRTAEARAALLAAGFKLRSSRDWGGAYAGLSNQIYCRT